MAQETATVRPDDLQALDLLGAVQLATSENESALLTFEKMGRLHPDSALAQYRLASVQSILGKTDRALTSAQRALELKPGYLQAQLLLASLHVESGHMDEALAIAQQLQDNPETLLQGYMLEGDLSLAQKEFAKAVQPYAAVLERAPTASTVLRKLHAAMTGTGDGQAADEKIRKWLQERPDDAGVRHYFAESLAKRGRFADAIGEYERLVTANPEHAVAMNNLAELYRFQKSPKALHYAEKAYSLRPENPIIADTLGWLLLEQGDFERALPIFEQAVSSAPNAITIRYHLAVAHEKSGNRVNAREELEQVLRAETRTAFPQLDEAEEMMRRLAD